MLYLNANMACVLEKAPTLIVVQHLKHSHYAILCDRLILSLGNKQEAEGMIAVPRWQASRLGACTIPVHSVAF